MRLRRHEPVRILAIGSSSTEGIGASSPAFSYPAQLQADLIQAWNGTVTVENAGKGGETITETIGRLEAALKASKPDLVIWQVGTNDAVKGGDEAGFSALLQQGIDAAQVLGVEVILVDQQYYPAIKDLGRYERFVSLVGATAAAEQVPVFSRYKLMKAWSERSSDILGSMLSSDGFHMGDRGYDCLAQLIADGLHYPMAVSESRPAWPLLPLRSPEIGPSLTDDPARHCVARPTSIRRSSDHVPARACPIRTPFEAGPRPAMITPCDRSWVSTAIPDHRGRLQPLGRYAPSARTAPGGAGRRALLKDESTHPSGSLKHRLARSLFLYGLCNGWIGQETTIVEASSGSTAVSEAYFARMLGLRFIAVMPRSRREKMRADRLLWRREPFRGSPAEMYAESARLAEELGGHYMDQFTYAERATDWRGNNNIAESIFGQMRRGASGPELDRGRRRDRRHLGDARALYPLPPPADPAMPRRSGGLGVPSPYGRSGDPHASQGRPPWSRVSVARGASRPSCRN